MIILFSMFTGYGGDEFALEKAGIEYKCIGYSEVDKNAIKCYEQNFKGRNNYGDCSKINPCELPDFNLLTAGFPCLDVSWAGNRDLSKGRTMLFKHIIRIAEVKKPEYMLLENVEGLMLNKQFWEYVKKELKRIGYSIIYKKLNSKDYGIPQNRVRVFIVCKLGQFGLGEYQWPLPTKQMLFNLGDIGLNKDMPYTTCLDTSGWIRVLGGWNGRSMSQRRLTRLSIRQCYHLMGFVDNQINLDNLTPNQCYKLFGNGWDINLVSLIFKRMFPLAVKHKGGNGLPPSRPK